MLFHPHAPRACSVPLVVPFEQESWHSAAVTAPEQQKHFSISTGTILSGTFPYHICIQPDLTSPPFKLPNCVRLGKVRVMALVCRVGEHRPQPLGFVSGIAAGFEVRHFTFPSSSPEPEGMECRHFPPAQAPGGTTPVPCLSMCSPLAIRNGGTASSTPFLCLSSRWREVFVLVG